MTIAPLTVLIVDDDPGDRTLEMIALSEQPFSCHVQVAGSIAEAVRHLDDSVRGPDSGFDVVLLDGHLDGTLSTPVIDYIRDHAFLRSLRVVVLSGSGNIADRTAFLAHGADEIIEKRTDFNDLILALAPLSRYARAA